MLILSSILTKQKEKPSNGLEERLLQSLQSSFSIDWTQVGGHIDGEAPGENAGHSVALSLDGSIIAIGAPYNSNGNGSQAGHVRVYKRNPGSSTWTQLGGDIDGQADMDQFGHSVALSSDGTIVAIGAIGNNVETGHVLIYQWNAGSSTWIQHGQNIEGVAEYDNFGWSLSLSSDGMTVAIGAHLNDNADFLQVRSMSSNGMLNHLTGLNLEETLMGRPMGTS